MAEMKKRVGVGRPPKFKEDRRPVTVTLPRRTLSQLAEINEDRAKAIVKCVDSVVNTTVDSEKRVDLVNVSEGEAVIIIKGLSRALQRIPWLRLIEITPFRYLLSIPSGTDVASLELAIMDLIESLPHEETSEKKMLMDLRERLSHQRRKQSLIKEEILYVDIRGD
mgnify:CR=1 FL=1